MKPFNFFFGRFFLFFAGFTENRKDSGSNAHNFGLLIKS